MSRDGQVVVFHDYKLKPDICRLGGKWIRKPTPRIKDLTLDELRAFDVGRHDPASDYAKARPTQCRSTAKGFRLSPKCST